MSVATVRCCLAAMRAGEIRDEELVPLTEGARRRATQGIDRESVLHAYRIGARALCEEIVGTLAVGGTVAERDTVAMAAWVLEFADRISAASAAAYSHEVARMNSAPEQQHLSQLFDAVLAGTWAEHHRRTDAFAIAHCVAVARARGV
ncbi:hypothetical protein [Streptomyces sp. NPDC004629]|uniref:hypothetical protein n=1 Tax=Streptomyces sp. NPDC004629 TaxID=3364705 RepID=UPI0036CC3FB6